MPYTKIFERRRYIFRAIAVIMSVMSVVSCSASPQSPQDTTLYPQTPTVAAAASNQVLALTQVSAQTALGSDSDKNQPRGYLTTPQELLAIKAKADRNIEPYKSAVK